MGFLFHGSWSNNVQEIAKCYTPAKMNVIKFLHTVLELPPHLKVTNVSQSNRQVTIVAESQSKEACCPHCGERSRHVHSHYWRRLQDLPLSQWGVALQICLVRFRCRTTACKYQTFTESLGTSARRYSRQTKRVVQLVTQLGFELGGQCGKRIAALYQIAISRSTVLRWVRRAQIPQAKPVRVLGVDDWAFCRGKRYGTILVDLEQQCVVDVLPDMHTCTVIEWLRAHPEVEVISRDRSYAYAEACQQGAPQALQVADRWHLLKNLWDALVVVYTKHVAALKQMTATIPAAPVKTDLDLPGHGVSKAQIARQLGVSLSLVKKYCRLDHLPKKQSPKFKPRLIAPYRDAIRQRLLSGHVTTPAMLNELQDLGFKGSRSTVYKALVQLRQELRLPSPLLSKPHPPHQIRVTPHQLAWWVFADDLPPLQHDLLQQAREMHPDLELATGLAQDFLLFVRQQKPHHLVAWIDAVRLTDLSALKQFARGLLILMLFMPLVGISGVMGLLRDTSIVLSSSNARCMEELISTCYAYVYSTAVTSAHNLTKNHETEKQYTELIQIVKLYPRNSALPRGIEVAIWKKS